MTWEIGTNDTVNQRNNEGGNNEAIHSTGTSSTTNGEANRSLTFVERKEVDQIDERKKNWSSVTRRW